LAELERRPAVGNALQLIGKLITYWIDVPAGVLVSIVFVACAGWRHKRLFKGDVGPLFGKLMPATGAGVGLTASLYYIGKAFALGVPTDCGGLSRNELTGAFAFSSIVGAIVAIRTAVLIFSSPEERAPPLPNIQESPSVQNAAASGTAVGSASK
jgi:hypothetical protein